ncbi:tape measure protein [Brevundimonas sp.]|uniref:tape measure protein n=1 Tax=Brevundimonas sp. TaxID=1871086 RepID=UPI0035B42D20
MARIVTEFTGDARNLQKNLKRIEADVFRLQNSAQKSGVGIGNNLARGVQSKQGDIQAAIRKSFDPAALKGDLIRLSGAIAAAFSVQQVNAAAESFTRYTNSLKVAGLAGANLTAVQERLYALAQQNGVALETMGELYGRLASAAKEVGATQDQLLDVTASVAAAVRISGLSAGAAAGPLLQMAQAIQAGTVRAEEFNSMTEGLMPLLQAAANASTKYGGSVAKMRADVLEGKLSSDEFLASLVAARTELETRASTATLTYSQALTVLNNAFIETIGRSDETLEVSTKVAQAIVFLAENLDTLGTALTVVAVALGSRYVAAATAAGVSSVRLALFQTSMTASMTGSSAAALRLAAALTTLRGAGAGVMAFFGGPLGLAITAVALGLGTVALNAMETSASLDRVAGITEQAAQTLENYEEQQRRAGEASGAVQSGADAAGNAVATFGIKAASAATNLREYAAAQREAALADINRQQVAIATERATLRGRSRDVRRQDPFGAKGSPSEEWNAGWNFISGEVTNWWTSGRSDRRIDSRLGELDRAEADLNEAAKIAYQDRTWESEWNSRSRGGGGDTPKTRGGRERREREIDYEANDAIALHEARMVELAARIAVTESLVQRHKLENQRAEAEQAAAIEAVKADKNLSDAGKAAVLASMKATQNLEDQARLRQQQTDLMEEAYRLDQQAVAASNRLSSIHETRLGILSRIAETETERWAIEDEAIALRRKAERDERALEERRLKALLKITQDAEKRAEILGQIDTVKAEGAAQEGVYQAEDDERRRSRMSDWQRYVEDVQNSTVDVQDTLLGAFETLEDGIAGVISGTKSLADVWRDVSASIIADIMRVYTRQLLLKPLMNAFGLGDIGKTLGVPGGVKSAPGRAIGDNNTRGGLYKINEGGTEGIILPQGSQIIPAGPMKELGRAQTINAGQTFHMVTNVYAEGAVMVDQLRQEFAANQMLMAEKIKNDAVATVQRKNFTAIGRRK